MSFSLNHKKLYLQTFWKFYMLLEINREIQKTKKIQTLPCGFRKNWIWSWKYCCFLEEHKPRGGKSREPWTYDVRGRQCYSVTFREASSVCTHRRNALISVVEGDKLKNTSSEESFPLEWVRACAGTVQFMSVLVLNFWAVLSHYKYVNKVAC